jgi:hypothetical protein
MQRYLTEFRLLLALPVLFMLLQLAITRHHISSESYSGSKESLTFLPPALYFDLTKHESLLCFTPGILLFSIIRLSFCTYDRIHIPIAVLVTDPSQSRAPPWVPILTA